MAQKARIYAEDPLRGFLPSTGPLLEYVEPPSSIPTSDDTRLSDCMIRVDSGVLPGSIISPYYDPMISKLIAYSPNHRTDAIDALKQALDRYVIQGIEQNTPFLFDVLRHKDFREGNTPTNFIDLHYPDGFSGVELSSEEQAELVAVAAAVTTWKREFLGMPPLSLHNVTTGGSEKLVVCIGGMFGNASFVSVTDGIIHVKHVSYTQDRGEGGDVDELLTDHKVSIDSIKYDPINPVVDVVINGVQKAIQVQHESNTGVFNAQYCGASFDIVVMSVEEYKLSQFMKEPQVLDTSNLILSPMPGTLVSYAVEDGDEVVEGQEICIVEAMKMQNVLRSPRSGVIKKLHAEMGSSLMTDETIVEFET